MEMEHQSLIFIFGGGPMFMTAQLDLDSPKGVSFYTISMLSLYFSCYVEGRLVSM